jgi:hypothetical protein
MIADSGVCRLSMRPFDVLSLDPDLLEHVHPVVVFYSSAIVKNRRECQQSGREM